MAIGTATHAGRNRQSVTLTEISAAVSQASVDRGAGVIRNVKILGYHSTNGRTYTREAIEQAAAAGLYENVSVFVDHPHSHGHSPSDRRANPGPRGVADRIGVLRNVHAAGDGLRGDLHLLKAHPLTALVLEAGEKNLPSFGLSHVVHGQTRRDGGRTVVEAIDRVVSVDIVNSPATNASLFEGDVDEFSPSRRLPNGVLRPVGKVFRIGQVKTNKEGSEMSSSLRSRLANGLREAQASVAAAKAVLQQGEDRQREYDGDDRDAADAHVQADGRVRNAFEEAVMVTLRRSDLTTAEKLKRIEKLLDGKDSAEEVLAANVRESWCDRLTAEGPRYFVGQRYTNKPGARATRGAGGKAGAGSRKKLCLRESRRSTFTIRGAASASSLSSSAPAMGSAIDLAKRLKSGGPA